MTTTRTKRQSPKVGDEPRSVKDKVKAFAPALIAALIILGLFVWITVNRGDSDQTFAERIEDGDHLENWSQITDEAGITLELPDEVFTGVQQPAEGVTVSGYQSYEGETGILYESIHAEPEAGLNVDRTVDTIVSSAPNGKPIEFIKTTIAGHDAREGTYTFTGEQGDDMIAWILVAQITPVRSITLTVVDRFDGHGAGVYEYVKTSLNFAEVVDA